MGEIERARSRIRPVGGEIDTGSNAGNALVANQTGLAGKAVTYVDEVYTPSQAWDLLSDQIRDWAQARAGHQIVDPHTQRGTVYWYCRVVGSDRQSSTGSPRSASYDLVMFARRGLAVSSGTTQQLVDARGATRWRHRRFDVPVDPGGIRHDHRRSTSPPPPPPGGRGDGAEREPASRARSLLPADVAHKIGNLPLPTQRFLLAPFTSDGRPPAEAAVHARLDDDGRELSETYWIYLFNARWLAFAHARRYVASRMSARLKYAQKVALLTPAPWAISAWTAPVARPSGQAMAPT